MRAALKRWMWRATCALVLWLSCAAGAWAQDDCAPLYLRKIVRGLDANTLDPNLVQDWMLRFWRADPGLAKGMERALVQKDVKTLIEGFRDLPPGVNPFGSDEAVYRAIGKYVDDNLEGGPGLNSVVGGIFADNAPNEKGSLFSLWFGEQLELAGKIVPGNGAGFEQTIEVADPLIQGASIVRRADIRVPHSAPGILGGIFYELKNWTTRLSGVGDARLVQFAGEFEKDIVLQQAEGRTWDLYRVAFRKLSEPDSDVIKARLLHAFASDYVKDRVPADLLADMRAAFDLKWATHIASFN